METTITTKFRPGDLVYQIYSICRPLKRCPTCERSLKDRTEWVAPEYPVTVLSMSIYVDSDGVSTEYDLSDGGCTSLEPELFTLHSEAVAECAKRNAAEELTEEELERFGEVPD